MGTYPQGWPPPQPSGRRSLRFFATGTATASYADNAFMFALGGGASNPASSSNPFTPMPVVQPGSSTPVHVGNAQRPGSPQGGGVSDARPAAVWSQNIRICNDGPGALEYSFDATADSGAGHTVHGILKANEQVTYLNRYEAGVAIRGNSGGLPVFRIEAW